MSISREDISSSFEDFEAAAKKIDLPIALDLETTGLVPFIAEPTWLSWACDGKVGAIPIEHRNPSGSNVPLMKLVPVLKELHRRSNSTVIWHNAAFDLSVLIGAGLVCLDDISPQSVFDTMLASYVLNPVKNNEGGKHALKFLYRETKSQSDPDQPSYDSVTKGKDFADILFDDAKWYSGFDAWAALRLHSKFNSEFSRPENCDLFPYFKNIEMPHVLTTVEILTTGMELLRQDSLPEELRTITDLYKEYDSTLAKVFDLAGHTFNFTSPKALRYALFRKAGINPLGRGKKSGQYSVDKWTLARIFAEVDSRVTKMTDRKDQNKRLIAWTLYAKLLIENIKKHEEFCNGLNAKTSRIHPQMRQTTSSGRYSCRSPNTLSMSTTSGIKQYLVPREGFSFVIADFSQIDLRVIANETAVVDRQSKMAAAVNNGADLHLNTLSIVDEKTRACNIKKIHYQNDAPVSYDEIDGENITLANQPELTAKIIEIKKKRSSIAKPLNFGISYGLGPKGLLSNLNNSDKFQEIIFKQLKDEKSEDEWVDSLSEQTREAGRRKFSSEHAAEFLAQFHAEYPEIPKFQRKIEEEDLQKTGSTTNIFGRRSRADGVQHLLSDNAVVDVLIGPGEWYRVACRGFEFKKGGFGCLVTKVQALEVGEELEDRKINRELPPLFELDQAKFDSAITQYQLGNICELALREAIQINFENGVWGSDDFFENVIAAAPTMNKELAKISDHPCLPFVCFTHSQIKFIQSGPLATFMRHPGYDALRRKLISYRVSSTSMDICKIAMIEFRKAIGEHIVLGTLPTECRPRIVNCIHDEIAVQCRTEDCEEVKSILKDCMSFKCFAPAKYLAQGRELLVEIEADIGTSEVSYAKAKPA